MEEGEDITRGTPLDHFAESEELLSIVSTLPQVCGEMRASENAIERFTGTHTMSYMHCKLNFVCMGSTKLVLRDA